MIKNPAEKYSGRFHPQLGRWIARWGSSDKEVAHELGISLDLFNHWRERHQAFAEAIEDGRNYWLTLASESMQKLIKGYDCEETTVEADKEGQATHITKSTRHIPPNAQAVLFHVKNERVFKMAKTLTSKPCEIIDCPFAEREPLF